jgi:DnaJ-class molecular chaperone
MNEPKENAGCFDASDCSSSDWEIEEFGPAFEYRDEFECPRCSGSGEVPTESHECYLGQQYKPCPDCGGIKR